MGHNTTKNVTVEVMDCLITITQQLMLQCKEPTHPITATVNANMYIFKAVYRQFSTE